MTPAQACIAALNRLGPLHALSRRTA
jgi:hypothetical protein